MSHVVYTVKFVRLCSDLGEETAIWILKGCVGFHIYTMRMSRIEMGISSAPNCRGDPKPEGAVGLLHRWLQPRGSVPGKRFRLKGKLFSLYGSLIDLSMRVVP